VFFPVRYDGDAVSSISDMEDQGADADWFEAMRRERERRHRQARRHSRLVRILKFALPAVSLVAVAAFVFFLYVWPDVPPGISAASVDLTHNSIVMQNPHVSGYMNGGRSYELSADRAEQSLENTRW
jgi:lipopolysaccharide export system protein LptC